MHSQHSILLASNVSKHIRRGRKLHGRTPQVVALVRQIGYKISALPVRSLLQRSILPPTALYAGYDSVVAVIAYITCKVVLMVVVLLVGWQSLAWSCL
jgi:hypothetical protein